MNDCIFKYGKQQHQQQYTWMAFLNVEDFIVIKQQGTNKKDIVRLLEQYPLQRGIAALSIGHLVMEASSDNKNTNKNHHNEIIMYQKHDNNMPVTMQYQHAIKKKGRDCFSAIVRDQDYNNNFTIRYHDTRGHEIEVATATMQHLDRGGDDSDGNNINNSNIQFSLKRILNQHDGKKSVPLDVAVMYHYNYNSERHAIAAVDMSKVYDEVYWTLIKHVPKY